MNKTQEEIDKHFIRDENKYTFHYDYIKKVSINILSEFKHEINLYNLVICIFKNDDDVKFLKKLIESGVNVNSKDSHGNILLNYAALRNSYKCAKVLIEMGSHIDNRNVRGHTPLHFACRHNLYECANLLIESGADVNSKNYFGTTPLKLAKFWSDKRVANLLIKHGAHE